MAGMIEKRPAALQRWIVTETLVQPSGGAGSRPPRVA
jgi:hypothetical protein